MFDTIYTRKGEAILVSPEDWRELAQYCWYIAGGYGSRNAYRPDGTHYVVRMHRQIMGYPQGWVDHVSRDRLDNRRENLRHATALENAANRKGWSASGFKGVYPNRRGWKAQIGVNGRVKYLGTYRTPEEAHEVYGLWAAMLFWAVCQRRIGKMSICSLFCQCTHFMYKM